MMNNKDIFSSTDRNRWMSQNEQSRSGLEFEPFQVSKLVISKVCRDGKIDSLGVNIEIIVSYVRSAPNW